MTTKQSPRADVAGSRRDDSGPGRARRRAFVSSAPGPHFTECAARGSMRLASAGRISGPATRCTRPWSYRAWSEGVGGNPWVGKGARYALAPVVLRAADSGGGFR